MENVRRRNTLAFCPYLIDHQKMFFIRMIATGFFVGRMPFAPGTWGTLVGIPIVFLFTLLGPIGYLVASVALVVLGIAAAEIYERKTQSHDASEIVIDEIAGFVITMAWLPVSSWRVWVAAFVLFRLLDITKPLLIGQIDRKVPGGWGVMLDDVLSGVVANVILQVVYLRTNWLGVQWPHL